MLVLTRFPEEDIIITPTDQNGNPLPPICIRVVAVAGSRVRIGVDAPRSYTVNRREIQEVIDKKEKVTS